MKGAYYHTKESVEEYVRLSEGFSGKDLTERLKKVVAPNATVLEVGSGPGTDWNILNETYSVVGSDNSTEFLNHLKAKNPLGESLELDAVTLKTKNRFDGIYTNKVLHHLKDDELSTSIKRQFDLLNSDEIVCHSFWKGEGSEVFKSLFVNYHDASNLKDSFENYFEVLLIEEYKEFEGNDSLLLIGKKKTL
jgi:cyclopropane fatty-acyl-phospholipid synthase-like methyltransferase